jgi:2'-5' RNA ligase
MGADFRTEPWEVTDLTLWRSHLTARAPQYEMLARYPLAHLAMG